jgi:hypothetical protein
MSNSRLANDQRLVAQGTLDQGHEDFEHFTTLGAQLVLLDTYIGLVEATRHPEND